MDRGRDRRYDEDDRNGGRETYRPTDRSGPPRSDYRGYRSPPRRVRSPPPYATDTYAPSDRRRSRSPAFRERGGGSYRGRPRSPPRGYSPRRDIRARSPLARTRRYSRSPVGRPRSPYPVRREPSPYRRPRSPIPVKRERVASPARARYDRRDHSPHRNVRPVYQNDNKYQYADRSLSPRRSQHISRMASPISSRRSSPHVHPDRMANTGSGHRSPTYRGPRTLPPPRDTAYIDRSPPKRVYSPVPQSPPREPAASRNLSPPPRNRYEYGNEPTPAKWSDAPSAPPPSHEYRNGDSRPPPSGPAYRGSQALDFPPEVPSAAPISMSAHNRPSSASLLTAPTRPRGGLASAERGSRDHGYSGPPPHRGSHAPHATPYHAPPRQQYDSRPPPEHTSYGSRPSHHGPPAPYEPPYRAPPPFRSNNSSSTTYPRTQRFNHLASVPAIKEGGEALPSLMDPAAKKRLTELEEGSKKLMEQIEERQREKRRNLREWEVRERESRRDGLRSELAEEALEAMSGEGTGMGSAF